MNPDPKIVPVRRKITSYNSPFLFDRSREDQKRRSDEGARFKKKNTRERQALARSKKSNLDNRMLNICVEIVLDTKNGRPNALDCF